MYYARKIIHLHEHHVHAVLRAVLLPIRYVIAVVVVVVFVGVVVVGAISERIVGLPRPSQNGTCYSKRRTPPTCTQLIRHSKSTHQLLFNFLDTQTQLTSCFPSSDKQTKNSPHLHSTYSALKINSPAPFLLPPFSSLARAF